MFKGSIRNVSGRRLFYAGVCSSLPCGHLLENVDLLELLCVMFSCAFVTFPYDFQGQVWYLIVSIPDLCHLPYFGSNYNNSLTCPIPESFVSL